MKIPGPDHPITIDKAGTRVTVRVGGRVVADTVAALQLDEAGHRPVYYIPIEDVDQAVLLPSDHTTYCPYKGAASYYDVVTDDGRIANAIWTYEEPYEAVRDIAGHVAFYRHLMDITAE